MGCAVGTVKFAVFVLNFILVCLGFAMVLFGALDSPIPNELNDLKDVVKEISLTSKVLIVAGAVVFVVAFFGCWGAVSDSSCMLFLYALFLMILVLAEAAIGVYTYLHKDNIKDTLKPPLTRWIQEYDRQENAKHIIDTVQSKWHCCGVESYRDWDTRANAIPSSCCKDQSQTSVSCAPSNAYQEGCLNKGERVVKEKFKTYLYVVAGVIGIEVIAILFSLIARNSILNDQRRSFA
ncbi:tetraspanin-9-like [Planococcus citri]|uniref:tetraspanin-9-like n=1 Tax=Planococcus citri TaxID=170843 RepID=UPI0031F98606